MDKAANSMEGITNEGAKLEEYLNDNKNELVKMFQSMIGYEFKSKNSYLLLEAINPYKNAIYKQLGLELIDVITKLWRLSDEYLLNESLQTTAVGEEMSKMYTKVKFSSTKSVDAVEALIGIVFQDSNRSHVFTERAVLELIEVDKKNRLPLKSRDYETNSKSKEIKALVNALKDFACTSISIELLKEKEIEKKSFKLKQKSDNSKHFITTKRSQLSQEINKSKIDITEIAEIFLKNHNYDSVVQYMKKLPCISKWINEHKNQEIDTDTLNQSETIEKNEGIANQTQKIKKDKKSTCSCIIKLFIVAVAILAAVILLDFQNTEL